MVFGDYGGVRLSAVSGPRQELHRTNARMWDLSCTRYLFSVRLCWLPLTEVPTSAINQTSTAFPVCFCLLSNVQATCEPLWVLRYYRNLKDLPNYPHTYQCLNDHAHRLPIAKDGSAGLNATQYLPIALINVAQVTNDLRCMLAAGFLI